MALATGARTQLRYIKESTFGTTPTVGTAKNLRRTNDDLGFRVQTAVSEEIRDDRQTTDLVTVSASAEGSINFELSYGEYDELLAAVLQGAWSNDVLTNGTVQDSFSIERHHADVNQFVLFRGMTPNTLELTLQSGAIVTGSFGFMGKDQAPISGTTGLPASPTASLTNDVMNAVSGVGNILEGGVALTGTFIKSLNLSVNNNLRARDGIGTLGSVSIGSGTLNITGTMSVYFANSTLYNKFLNGTRTSLSFTIADGAGNEYEWELPAIKFSEGTLQAGSKDADSMLDLGFTAIMDTVTNKMIRITRTPAE